MIFEVFCLSKKVTIACEATSKDRFGRTLGYIYIENGTLVNLKIIKDGFGFAYTRFPFSKMEEFRSVERLARKRRIGLWANNSRQSSESSSKDCSPKRCTQIESCDEAMRLLKVCPHKSLDEDRDGILVNLSLEDKTLLKGKTDSESPASLYLSAWLACCSRKGVLEQMQEQM